MVAEAKGSTFPTRTLTRTVSATLRAIESVRHQRYFDTERGYQGGLSAALQEELSAAGILGTDLIPEEEYQKRKGRHGLTLRPDIIVHVPTPSGATTVRRGNLAVFLLKLEAFPEDATDDFGKLDRFFTRLDYALGFFININGSEHYLSGYSGKFTKRLHSISIEPNGSTLTIRHGYFSKAGLRTDIIHSEG